MWRDYPQALIEYMNISIDVWKSRGFNNTMVKQRVEDIVYPHWLGDTKFHDSHKANLLSKDYDFRQKHAVLLEWIRQGRVEIIHV
jgi:hypothetical protein